MTAPSGGYMRGGDAFAWYMERDPALRSTVVAIFWLDRAPDWDVLSARIDRMARLIPGLRQRVVESPFRLAPPRWTYDPQFDLTWHLRRAGAPTPKVQEAVLALARRSAMDAFDRDRPLWELTLVEGTDGGPAALVFKVHHSLSDGVGGMRMLAVMLDLQREPPDISEMPPAPPGETLDLAALVTGAAGALAGRAVRLGWLGAKETIPVLVRYARNPAGELRGAAVMARSVYRTAAPLLDTKSPLMRERGMTRRLAVWEVPLKALTRAAKTADGTVNDAYMAAVTGGLRRYHERNSAAVESLRAVMPISLRSEQEMGWGNRITLQRVTVPVAEPDPATRMRMLHRVTAAARNEPSLTVTDAIAEGLNLLPAGYVGGVLKRVDFLASNVPGIPVPVYLAGSKITGIFAFGPTIGAALNVTLLSYCGTCHIAINIDTAAVPDPDVLLECLRDSFDEILRLGAAGPKSRPLAGRRRASPRLVTRRGDPSQNESPRGRGEKWH
jgi:diacylglycerol O-acyltransferase / wax synthase